MLERIDEYDDGKYLFVPDEDGKDGWIPMTQAVLESPQETASLGTPPLPHQTDGPRIPKDEDGVEESRWKLKSGTAIVFLPTEMNLQDFKVLRGQIDLLELSTLGEITTNKPKSN